ncbi:hypothetical protein PC9H_000871 [Pleurotus ostreatus]|uniref:DUF4211 domain-containing protein n=1 Tax=Pleurotus ostreatus TaxID=5322 RepID=A0A8H7DX83_PLEOS|nr:uncharacterized protein PC9H_000871 [Pleurotus ostreatus]KAF7440525.1 hypothetical protein PC9H_000871 [Pleurotus ostreatus]
MPKPRKSIAPKKPKLSQVTLDEIFKGATRTKESRSKCDANSSESEPGEKSDEGLGDIHFERKASAVTTDDDVDDLEVMSPRRSFKRRKVVNSDGDQAMPPLSSPTSHIQITDSEDEVIPIRKSKRRKQNVVADSDDDADDARPSKRKLRKKSLSPATSDEDLAGEVEEERILDSRLRQRGRTSLFQKNLEKLKRRKQGRMVSDSSEQDSSEEDATTRGVVPFDGAKPDCDDESEGGEDEEQEDDNFIVDDDGAGFTELPVEFSMSTHEDLAHQFKIIFQFFVHIAIQPPQDRHEFMSRQMKTQQYFSVPLQIVRRKLSGLRDSLVASSVWRADFKTALSTFPEFGLDDLQFALPHGHPYDPVGFESTTGDSSDEDESPIQFHLGRFCARRTRYTLFGAIRREIDELHERSRVGSSKRNFVRIAFAGATQPPDDLTDADAICEYLDSRKVIDMEWQSIKLMMDSAQNLEMARKKGDDIEG